MSFHCISPYIVHQTSYMKLLFSKLSHFYPLSIFGKNRPSIRILAIFHKKDKLKAVSYLLKALAIEPANTDLLNLQKAFK